MPTFIDLSTPLENSLHSDPEMMLPKIHYMKHDETYAQIEPFFPGLKKAELPDGEAWAVEFATLCTHNGTHMDAPYHYATTQDGGKRAYTIDEIPLDWCFAPGVKLDLREYEDGYVLTKSDLESELAKLERPILERDIVLINTRAGSCYNTPEYLHAGCGMGREATLHLLQKGVRVTGTDAWSWDAPFSHTAKRYAQEKDPSIIWEGHKAGRERAYCHMEKLCNLESLPSQGFQVSCFPVKIKGASAGWVRAVAIT